jgi:undecaprenyl diphosphate synthase
MFFFKKRLKKQLDGIDLTRLPVHIAIIPDGNGRWAKKRGLSRNFGHREGANAIKKIAAYCDDIGIKYLTIFAFSTENWVRPKSEVDTLMSLLLDHLKNAEKEMGGRNISIKVIGDKAGLPIEFQNEIKRVEKSTQKNTGLQLIFAINYGGRDDILHACKETIKSVTQGEISIDKVDLTTITKKLYTKDIPDPDLLIRTSGEKRISNFLLWQSAYTEFWYSDVLWPDFREKNIKEAIEVYQNRNRRFGGV